MRGLGTTGALMMYLLHPLSYLQGSSEPCPERFCEKDEAHDFETVLQLNTSPDRYNFFFKLSVLFLAFRKCILVWVKIEPFPRY